MSAETQDETGEHPCRVCRRPIAERYRFTMCVRCSLDALERDPDVLTWREAKKTAAYDRLRAAGLVKGR